MNPVGLFRVAAVVVALVVAAPSARASDTSLTVISELTIAWRIVNRCPDIVFLGNRSVERLFPYAIGRMDREGRITLRDFDDTINRTPENEIYARMTSIMAGRGYDIENVQDHCVLGRSIAGRGDAIGRWLEFR